MTNQLITNPIDRPHFVGDEVNERLHAMFNAGLQDTEAAHEVIGFEYPELGGRQTGLAVMWAKETYGR